MDGAERVFWYFMMLVGMAVVSIIGHTIAIRFVDDSDSKGEHSKSVDKKPKP